MADLRLAACCVFVASLACGEPSDGDEPPLDESDAAVAACEPTLKLGYCIDQATGEPCLDFQAENRQFVPLGPTEVVPAIVGPQGAEMYVLAVRAVGIDPGTIEDPPRANVVVYFDGEERGRFTSFPAFFPDDDAPGAMVAPQLFTVVFMAAELEGETLSADGIVENPGEGREFCGDATFVGGAVIDPDA